jgi:hypothetical protein
VVVRVENSLLMKAGVGTKLLPPPNSGHSLVRKSCRWAATIPVAAINADPGLSMMNITRSIANGIHGEGIWKIP